MHSIGRIFFIPLLLSLFFTSSVQGENLYDPATGELFISIIQVDENTSVSGRFNLVSTEPLIWAAIEFTPVAASSRTQAVYDGSDNSLYVPEINIQQNLFSLRFEITENCDASICLEPDVSSLVANGREGSAVFTTALTSASTFSCASCHAMSEVDGFAMDGIRRPGHPLENAPLRGTFKDGSIDNLLAAVNICVTEWMNADPLASDDSDWINLLNWLEDQNTEEVIAPITIDIVPPATDLAGGDGTNGRELFNTRCIVCHGFDGEGTQLAPQITNRGLSADLIAFRVRTSGRANSAAYQGLTGGVMPFWGANRLSDGELADIVAYVSAGEDAEVIEGMDDVPAPVDGACTSNSFKIGQQAVFREFAHDVAGTATIIDDCTIEITNFVFDGGGINVQFYLGLGGDFRESRGGFSASGNLVGVRFNGNTLRITLPAGKTTDDFDSISVWCVPVGVSFGSGFFS